MLLVALTGGIAVGKSIAADVFESLGCYVDHADRTARRLMQPGKDAWKKIVAHFGRAVLNPDGSINRERLAGIIFSNPREREIIDNIVHPLVHEEKKRTISKLRQDGAAAIYISESALIIESGTADFYDKIVVVVCPEKIQTARLMERDHISRKTALMRIKSQLRLKEKRKYADYLIDSSGSFRETVEQTEKVYRYLLRDRELKDGIRS